MLLSTLSKSTGRCLCFSTRNFKTAPAPKLFEYNLIKSQMKASSQINSAIENAFGMLAKGLVDVPIPMHIGIHESDVSLVCICNSMDKFIQVYLSVGCRSRRLSYQGRIH